MDAASLANSKANAPPKRRFAPKAPPKRDQKPVVPKIEKTENDIDDVQKEQLLQKLKESSARGRPKVERKVEAAQVAFGHGSSSKSTRSYGGSRLKPCSHISSSNGVAEHIPEKEYKEPWNYYTNYPVTLPLRRPYSGNPEILDKEEFEGEAETTTDDEHATNHAEELGLVDENPENNKLIFLQLPKVLPMAKQSPNGQVNEMDNNPNQTKVAKVPQKPVNVANLPGGFMGKLLVYKSGAVKLKLGDTLYDVSAGVDCLFAQDVVAINTQKGYCCNLGEVNKRAIVHPDIDSVLDSMNDL